MKILISSLIFSLSVLAGTVESFQSKEMYRIEGTLEKKFFVINKESSNEQRIKLASVLDMVHGAQYSICLKVRQNCHMECHGDVIGKPKFITPDRDPKPLIPDVKGVYAPADQTQCP